MARKRGGKYVDVIGKLPKLKPELTEAQIKVNELKARVREGYKLKLYNDALGYTVDVDEDKAKAELAPTAQDMANDYEAFRLLKDSLEAQVSAVNKAITCYEQLVADQFEIEGIEGGLRYSLDADDRRLLTVKKEPFAQVKDRDKYRQWCIDNGFANELNLAWGTTNSTAKEMLLNGDFTVLDNGDIEVMPGVTIFAKDTLVLRTK